MDRRTFVKLSASLPAWLGGTRAFAGYAPVSAENGIAIAGADTVAYFMGMGAVAGSISERVMWRGATWLFVSRQHREMFERDPKRFAPRFGGYCAYTLSQGSLAPGDPRAFAIHDGRLYLVRSPSILGAWTADLIENLKLAETHWPGALG